MNERIWAIGVTALLAVCLVVAGAGCPSNKGKDKDAAPGKDKAAKDKGGKHDHLDEGPHEGALAEWGDEEYHAEFTAKLDGKVTVYILGKDAKTAAPIKAEKIRLSLKEPRASLELKASPQKGDPKGSASAFEGMLPEKARGKKKLAGTISGEVDGKPYAGDFKETHIHRD